VQEIQDNSGLTEDGGANLTLATLANAIKKGWHIVQFHRHPICYVMTRMEDSLVKKFDQRAYNPLVLFSLTSTHNPLRSAAEWINLTQWSPCYASKALISQGYDYPCVHPAESLETDAEPEPLGR